MKRLLGVISLLAAFTCYAANKSLKPPEILHKSRQLVLVTTPTWNAIEGTLQCYERKKFAYGWKPVGDPVPVIIGEDGLALVAEFQHYPIKGPLKKEGDRRTPMGVYELGPLFGFDKQSTLSKNVDYIPINPSTVCVDDQKSRFYNKIIDSRTVSKPDWDSKEEMRDIPIYEYGSVIQYNTQQPISGSGSCIFLHLWREPSQKGTAGCIVMDEEHLKEIFSWLDQSQKPTIAIFTKPFYADIRAKWELP